MAAKLKYPDILKRYSKRAEFKRIKAFAKDKQTPFLIIDLEEVSKNYDHLKNNLPEAEIFYAIKANPHPDILKTLAKKGSCFDVASIYELDDLLKTGISPDRISYGNTIKKQEHIKYFYKRGVRLFATDSISDLRKIARNAPKSKVFFRLLVDGAGSDWPLSKKFGAHPDMIHALAKEAKHLGLHPYGISFHVGSQQRDVEQWDQAISQAKYLFETLAKEGIHLEMLNLGGGLPSEYLFSTPGIRYYTTKLRKYLKYHFRRKIPKIYIEPGRYMVGTAGTLVTEVVLIAKKAESMRCEWMYLDAGLYNGLDETVNESVKYPILTDVRSKSYREFVLAGPTCDSHDILYEQFLYRLPSTIKEGSRLYFMTAGAYTYQVSAVGFNGLPPLNVYVLK